MASQLFKLEKLEIAAFTDSKRKTPAEPPTFEARFNPTTFSRSYGLRWIPQQGIGGSGADLRYARTDPSELKLVLVEDGTGVAGQSPEGIARQTVEERIEAFLSVAYRRKGEIHEPGYLKISWGAIDFPCRLSALDIRYDLFDRRGKPLRAELHTTFVSDLDPTRRAKKANDQSADLSHRRLVRSGDTLPLLTHEIYGTSALYLNVARFNELDDIRNLEPGRTLVFPPRDSLEKGSAGDR